jgi:hypothetical protein
MLRPLARLLKTSWTDSSVRAGIVLSAKAIPLKLPDKQVAPSTYTMRESTQSYFLNAEESLIRQYKRTSPNR